MHWLQIIEAPELRQFNYGEKKNLNVYNSTEPPRYDIEVLKKLKIDMFITISNEDPYCLEEDYEENYKYFISAKIKKKYLNAYNHLDYIWGKNAHIDIYEDMYKFLLD